MISLNYSLGYSLCACCPIVGVKVVLRQLLFIEMGSACLASQLIHFLLTADVKLKIEI